MHDFVLAPEFTEVVKNGDNGLSRVTIPELPVLDEWMFGQYYTCLFLVVMQGPPRRATEKGTMPTRYS